MANENTVANTATFVGLSSYIGCNASIVPQADATKANATQLDYGITYLANSLADDDSVLLPPAKARAMCVIINGDSAQDIQVFGQGTDTINDVATATGIAQGQKTVLILTCPYDGAWYGTPGTAW